jgi:hypothetical protein
MACGFPGEASSVLVAAQLGQDVPPDRQPFLPRQHETCKLLDGELLQPFKKPGVRRFRRSV